MSYRPLELTDVFKFGKYQGCQVEDVIHDDPQYFVWLIDEEIVEFDEEVTLLLEKLKII